MVIHVPTRGYCACLLSIFGCSASCLPVLTQTSECAAIVTFCHTNPPSSACDNFHCNQFVHHQSMHLYTSDTRPQQEHSPPCHTHPPELFVVFNCLRTSDLIRLYPSADGRDRGSVSLIPRALHLHLPYTTSTFFSSSSDSGGPLVFGFDALFCGSSPQGIIRALDTPRRQPYASSLLCSRPFLVASSRVQPSLSGKDSRLSLAATTVAWNTVSALEL